MFRTDDPSAVSAMPTSEAAGAEGYFTEGNPGITPATLVRASFLNMIQEELRAVVVAGGVTPAKASNSQVLSAINALIAPTGISKFSSSLAANGYQNLPGGWIEQFGSAVTDASGNASVTFPIQFTTSLFNASVSGANNSGNVTVSAYGGSTSGMNIKSTVGSAGTSTAINYRVIGK